ncbi:MAG: hypothetical protein AAF495_18005 [Pseudomonadota bacterium]
MSKIYEVHSIALNGKPHSWGARTSRAEAENLLAEWTTGRRETWAKKHHKNWWIEEIDVTGMFTLPPAPTPRELFSTRVSTVESTCGTWNTLRVDILDQAGRVAVSYERNHPSLYRTFEPFRQGERMLALISSDYTATSVIDLGTGEVLAAEEPSSLGFCPAGFYVPDWWDVHDGRILPGSTNWSGDLEVPTGNFGFVWGCVWGDDSSWKVQYLDLTHVQEGKLLRDERFGYVELADHPKLDAKDFIRCSFYQGRCNVTFATLTSYDLASGERLPSEFE